MHHPGPIKVLADKRSQQQINKKISEKFWQSARSDRCRQFSHSWKKKKPNKENKQQEKVAIFHFYLPKTSSAQSRLISCNCQRKTKASRNAKHSHRPQRLYKDLVGFFFFFFLGHPVSSSPRRGSQNWPISICPPSPRMTGPDKMAATSVLGSPVFFGHSCHLCQRASPTTQLPPAHFHIVIQASTMGGLSFGEDLLPCDRRVCLFIGGCQDVAQTATWFKRRRRISGSSAASRLFRRSDWAAVSFFSTYKMFLTAWRLKQTHLMIQLISN